MKSLNQIQNRSIIHKLTLSLSLVALVLTSLSIIDHNEAEARVSRSSSSVKRTTKHRSVKRRSSTRRRTRRSARRVRKSRVSRNRSTRRNLHAHRGSRRTTFQDHVLVIVP